MTVLISPTQVLLFKITIKVYGHLIKKHTLKTLLVSYFFHNRRQFGGSFQRC